MSRREIKMVEDRERMLNNLIAKYGFESEPVLYFSKFAWIDIHNAERYYKIAINWRFETEM